MLSPEYVIPLLLSVGGCLVCQAHMNQAGYGVQQQAASVQHHGQQPHPAGAYGAVPGTQVAHQQHQPAASINHHQQQQQQVAQMGHPQQAAGNMLRDKAQIQDKAHIQEHLQEIIGDGQDTSKMTEDELQFHYFKLHDNDDNNRLDGLELVKSLIHWHVEEHKHMQAAQGAPAGINANQPGGSANAAPGAAGVNGHATTKIFNDVELQQMIDPILEMDDTNRDGYIDYPEFVAAQKQRAF